jgi:hypothetical protein
MSLQTGTQVLTQSIPDRVIFGEHNYTSTSDSALNRRVIEIAPTSDEALTVNSGGSVTFQIASNTSFIDFRNSYIRCKMTVANTNATNDVMETVGIHSCFESWEWSAASTNTIINKENMIHVREALMRKKGYSKSDAQECMMGDFSSHQSSQWLANDMGDATHDVIGPLKLAANAGITAGVTNIVVDQDDQTGLPWRLTQLGLGEGDVVHIASTAGAINAQLVLNAAPSWAASQITMTGYLDSGILASLVDNTIVNIIVDRRNRAKHPTWGLANDASKIVHSTFKPPLGIMKMDKLFPLFLMSRGFNLTGRLDSTIATRGFVQGTDASVSPTHNVKLSDFRFVAVMYDMHSVINQQYIDLYSNRGLLFPFVQYTSNQTTIPASTGDQMIDLNVGQRSVRHGFARLTTDILYGETANGRLNNSLSSAFSLGLENYQFSSGSLFYPLRPVNIEWDEDYALDNEERLKIMLRKKRDRYDSTWVGAEPHNAPSGSQYHYNDVVAKPRIKYKGKNDAAVYYVKDKDGVVMNAVFAREEDGLFSGLDTSVQPIRLTCGFKKPLDDVDYTASNDVALSDEGTLGSKRFVQSFIASDAYLHISEASGVSKLS